MAVVLTGRQFQIYSFIKDRISFGHRPPTIREIANETGIRSPNGVICHLDALEQKGAIVRDGIIARGIALANVEVVSEGVVRTNDGVAKRIAEPKELLRRSLWRHATPGEPDDCWECRSSKGKDGYALLKINGHSTNAQRISWVLHFGEIPDGMIVCHHCDNPPCVNPNHLFLGTHQNNKDDMIRKGRGRWQQPWVPDFHV